MSTQQNTVTDIEEAAEKKRKKAREADGISTQGDHHGSSEPANLGAQGDHHGSSEPAN
ncbi:hypothetical protein [Streptomyces sp. Z26]|uniref:hypothetical protein n=1 Tax=Streptomyces TaxID=1883 RepID=UPI001404AD6C|nr:hypothetical protein [Streptomyces sp. Z26]